MNRYDWIPLLLEDSNCGSGHASFQWNSCRIPHLVGCRPCASLIPVYMQAVEARVAAAERRRLAAIANVRSGMLELEVIGDKDPKGGIAAAEQQRDEDASGEQGGLSA